jgi:hypothetical protein
MIEEYPPSRSEFNPPRFSLQQLHAQFQFEIANLATQRRLCSVKSPLGGLQKAAFLCNRNEVTEMTKLHCKPLYLCFISISQTIKAFVQTPDA